MQAAAPLIGIEIEGDPGNRFSLRPARKGAVDPLLTALETYSPRQRKQLSAVRPADRQSCIWVHPGEPVFEDFRELVRTKLGKDALYESIIDPSAGISFDYEAWQVNLKNGDEAFGLIISETADEITVKTQTGIVTSYKKIDIESRQKMTMSIMPAGLQQAMPVSDLVDLVEYLASLRTEQVAN